MTTPKHVSGTIKTDDIALFDGYLRDPSVGIPWEIRIKIADAIAAIQPDPEPVAGGCGYPCGYDCNGACFDGAEPQPVAIQPDPEPKILSASEFLDFTRPLPDHPYDEQFDNQSDVEANPCGAWAAIQHMAHHIYATPSSAGMVSVEAALFEARKDMQHVKERIVGDWPRNGTLELIEASQRNLDAALRALEQKRKKQK